MLVLRFKLLRNLFNKSVLLGGNKMDTQQKQCPRKTQTLGSKSFYTQKQILKGDEGGCLMNVMA